MHDNDMAYLYDKSEPSESESIGKSVGNFDASEWYAGGELGTSMSVVSGSYENETPAVTEQGLTSAFNAGEFFFERDYNLTTEPFDGLGPAMVRKSCLDCHPGYGHGQWQSSYIANGSRSRGNGYLLVVYYADDATSNDGPYTGTVTGMPQTMAVEPFLPPIDESGITINWLSVSSMPSGIPMQFEDGEKYELIYPEITIAESAFNTDPTPFDEVRDPDNKYYGKTVAFRLESTIGVPGTGLVDAIPQDSIRAQYRAEAPYVELNPNFWDTSTNDFAASAMYTLAAGARADGSTVEAGTKTVKRFTYAMTRGSLQDGAGANAIWNITNVTRGDRRYLYTTKAWAKKMGETESVIDYIKEKGDAGLLPKYLTPFYGDGTKENIAYLVEHLLGLNKASDSEEYTKYFVSAWGGEDEMSDEEFYNFMVWHRGLAMPRARNLQSSEVQRGKELFMSMGCARCHRPRWQTTDDNYWTPTIIADKPLPRYQNQTIYPYSDFIHHRLYMANDIHGTWCRTTPLWGRGLSKINTGRGDRLHDCRARNTLEAIMWHGYSAESDAYESTKQFYELSKEDRDAVVKFVDSI